MGLTFDLCVCVCVRVWGILPESVKINTVISSVSVENTCLFLICKMTHLIVLSLWFWNVFLQHQPPLVEGTLWRPPLKFI